jgi:hypothetical protein
MLLLKGLTEDQSEAVYGYLDDSSGQAIPEAHLDWMIRAKEEELVHWIAEIHW